MISVGAHNDYGLPAPSLLAELERLGRLRRAPTPTATSRSSVRGAALHVVVRTGARGRQPRPGAAEPGGPASAPARHDSRSLAVVSDLLWPTTALSVPHARMAQCQPAPSRSTTSRGRSRPSSCSSATRSCWSAAQSARSPPLARRDDPAWWRPSALGSEIDGPELHELLGPSLFGDAAAVLIAQRRRTLRTAALAVLRPYLPTPTEGTTIVVQHAGGAKGKAVLEAAAFRRNRSRSPAPS